MTRPAVASSAALLFPVAAHPDRPRVIQPLRSGLAEQGWQSLSIQMPLLPEGSDTAAGQRALPDESAERIRTALAWLENHGAGNVTNISHSRGGAEVLYLAATRLQRDVVSLVVVSVNGRYQHLPEAAHPVMPCSR